ncbi:GntR family transcriptional regulator [Catenuloplanes japonicus]|uniref:GntR family transcriptional regulator n=1 Tax=Catenuloplanes japonicus TaxID=33876 RepID=UPI00052503F8|nr:GntR family transcriptional regulator [Catenuloplanes japonicus]
MKIVKPQNAARLPTEPQLMNEYSVSRNTVRLATGLLVNEGLVESVPGRSGGMVVRAALMLTYHASRAEMEPGFWPESDAWFGEVQAQGYEPSQRFEMRIAELPAELAERLGVEADSPAGLRRCIRLVNGKPSSLQDTWYPMDLCEQVPELLSPRDVPQGTTRLLADRGFPQPAVEDDLVAMMPTPEHVQLLGLAVGTPVLAFTRTGFSPDRPVRVSVTIFAGHLNRVVYTLGDPAVIARHREER